MITFKTPGGTNVKIEIVTEVASEGDHTVMVPCYDLHITVADKTYWCGWSIKQHAQHGWVLEPYIGGIPTIKIPDSALLEVQQFIGDYKARVAAQVAEINTEKSSFISVARAKNNQIDAEDA